MKLEENGFTSCCKMAADGGGSATINIRESVCCDSPLCSGTSTVLLYRSFNMADLLWSSGCEFLAVVCSTGIKVVDGR